MNRALVPYEPRGHNAQSARAGFADFLRRGGRARPVPFGAFSDRDDVEAPKPKCEDTDVGKILKAQSRSACATQFAAVVALVLVIVVFIFMAVVVSRVNDSIIAVNSLVAPHAHTLVNKSLGMLSDVSSSMTNVETITSMTAELAVKDFGPDGPASAALNSTAVIARKLSQFMQKPELHISLGQ